VIVPAPPSFRSILRRSSFEIRRRFRRPVAGRFQPYAHTLPDRYPWLFDFAAATLDRVPTPRLLSFGCSRGDEVFSLRRRFPQATIKGIDIDPRNIAACISAARSLNDDRLSFEVEPNTRKEPSRHYDAIFCLAVLCHGDLTVLHAKRCDHVLRFEDFERTVADLARCLKPNGILFIHTSNFRFCDTMLADTFDVVLEAVPDQMAPDVLFDRQGRLMPGERYFPVGFRKRVTSDEPTV
jgi:SAM-dependent methyltransferase